MYVACSGDCLVESSPGFGIGDKTFFSAHPWIGLFLALNRAREPARMAEFQASDCPIDYTVGRLVLAVIIHSVH